MNGPLRLVHRPLITIGTTATVTDAEQYLVKDGDGNTIRSFLAYEPALQFARVLARLHGVPLINNVPTRLQPLTQPFTDT